MGVSLQPTINWRGHSFAFLLRVDVEHVAAQQFAGDARAARVATMTLLDALEPLGLRHDFALLGSTAELYPDLAREIAERHAILGHSMFFQPYPSMPVERQQRDIRRMRNAIEEACGVKVRGLACPHQGLADEQTLRAAAAEGLDYVISRLAIPDSKLPRMIGLEGMDRPIVVPGGGAVEAADWSDRQRSWPSPAEPFCAGTAEQRWRAMVDRAHAEGRLCMLVIHPWMLHVNEHELRAVLRVITHARDSGAWCTTYDELVDMVLDRA